VIHVVLAEDHTLVRDGIRTLLAMVPDLALAGTQAVIKAIERGYV
jgi:DNA-binding NarL/FixJ family response regulator